MVLNIIFYLSLGADRGYSFLNSIFLFVLGLFFIKVGLMLNPPLEIIE